MRNGYDIRPGGGHFTSEADALRRYLKIGEYKEKSPETDKWPEIPASTFPSSGSPGGDGGGSPWLAVVVMLFIEPLRGLAVFIIGLYALIKWGEKKRADRQSREIEHYVRKGRKDEPSAQEVLKSLAQYEAKQAKQAKRRASADPADKKKRKEDAKKKRVAEHVVFGAGVVGRKQRAARAASVSESLPLPAALPQNSLMRHTVLYQARVASAVIDKPGT
jgi:hypothetical protein